MKIQQKQVAPFGGLNTAADGTLGMVPLKIWVGSLLVAVVTGCVGYVDSGYYGGGYSGVVVVPAPTVYFWGGGYERGYDVHGYSHRGYESRSRR